MNKNQKKKSKLTRIDIQFLFSIIALIFIARVIGGQALPPVAGFDFKGRLLISVSDADMVASAYADGNLGPAEGTDALSIIRLDRLSRISRAVEIPVSNSVTAAPAAVAVTPDGKYAFVIETREPRPAGKTAPKIADLALGRALVVVSLSDPDQPKIVQRVQIPAQPTAVAVNPTGSLVAVSFGKLGAGKTTPLILYPFADGKTGAPLPIKIPDWNLNNNLINIEFHPRENVLALLDETSPALSFIRVAESGGKFNSDRWGNSLSIENAPYLARFTPDGRYVLVNSTYTSPNVLPSLGVTTRGSVASIRLADKAGTNGAPEHRLVSRAATGITPEGLTISPNGRWAVTTNLEYSFFALDDPRQGFFSSLTLLRLNPETGTLAAVGEFPFDGILPESVVFDNSSRFLAVTNYDHYDEKRAGGSIDFWRLAEDSFDPTKAALVKMNYSVPVTRGAHTMVIVR